MHTSSLGPSVVAIVIKLLYAYMSYWNTFKAVYSYEPLAKLHCSKYRVTSDTLRPCDWDILWPMDQDKPTFQGSILKHFPGRPNRVARSLIREVQWLGNVYDRPGRDILMFARSTLVTEEVRAKLLAIEKDWDDEVQREWGDPEIDEEEWLSSDPSRA